MRASNELEELFGHNPPDRASQHDVDDPRAGRGTMVPLYTRMMRYFAGDPVSYQALVSTGTGNVQVLPDYPDVRQVVAYVAGNDILYRVDGGIPNPAGDQRIQQGSTITLTGMPTIKGFQFVSAVAGNATLFCTYYD
jgi:hypothetical protein